ncbi:MAG: phage tail tape measure protein [Ruminococcus sp.]|nr:phage tail tape measure protein [Ruminococcus sp.]
MSIGRKEYQLLLKIGGKLSNDFNTSFAGACERVKELARESKETSNTLKDVSGYQKTQTALDATKEKLIKQQEEYKKLREEIEDVAQNAVNEFNEKLEKQKSKIEATERDFERQITTLQDLKKEESDLGSSTKLTRKLEKQQEKVESLAEKLGKQKKRYEELKKSQNEAKDPTEKLTNQLHEQEERIRETEAAIEDQRQSLGDYSDSLRKAGIDVSNLTEEEQRLREEQGQQDNALKIIQKIGEEHERAKQKVKEQAVEVGKLVGVYAAAGAAIYKSAIEPAIEFESAYTGVLKTVDGTPEQLQQIKNEILELSAVTPTSAAGIAEVAEAAGQLGIAAENITDFSSVMIDLGESTDLSATQAASDLAKFANITKMEADKYSNLGSVIVDLGNNFATTESDIVEMAARLASTGDIVGLSEAQIMAVAAALSSVGIEAEAGGSSISKLLKQFDTMYWNDDETLDLDERKLDSYAKVAGVTIDEFKEIYGRDSLEAVSMFISGLNDVERNGKNAVQILGDLGIDEVRMSNAVLSLASSDDILTKTVQTANAAWEENTALAVEAGKRYETTQSKIEMAKNSINNAGIALGEVFMPYIAEAAQGINEFAQETAKWIRENPKIIEQTTSLATSVGGTLLAFKGFKLAGAGIQTAVTGVKKLAAEGKLLSSVKWGVIGIGIAALSAAVAESHKQYQKHLEDTTNAIMYSNGAKTSLAELTDAIVDYDDEAYKAAVAANEQAQELKAVRDSLSEARRELEYYKETVDGGALSTEEAEALQSVFENLADYLEQDFSGAYSSVFNGFKNAVIEIGDEVGIASGEVARLFNSFKTDYNANIDKANQNVQNYLDKAIAGNATESDREEFEKAQSMLYELAALKSESKKSFEAAITEIDGIDFGADQEAAVSKINEITEYAKSYFEEINAAQAQIQSESDEMLAELEIQHKYGDISDEYYETYKGALATAAVASNMAYQKTVDEFKTRYEETLSLISRQLDENIRQITEENMGELDLGWDLLGSAKSLYIDGISGFLFKGISYDDSLGNMQESFWNDKRERTEKNVREGMSDILNAVNEMSKAADIDPIIIPIETKITAATSGLLKNVPGSGAGYLSLDLENIEIVKNAYAVGTENAVNGLGLVGENGPEIIRFSGGEKVYTAEETKDIFDAYTQMASYMPRFTAVRENKGSEYSGIEAARGKTAFALNSGKDIKCEINYSPAIYIDSGNAEELEAKLRQNNENVLKLFKDYMREEAENERRMSFA